MMRKHLDINKPSHIEVGKYLKLWDSLELKCELVKSNPGNFPKYL